MRRFFSLQYGIFVLLIVCLEITAGSLMAAYKTEVCVHVFQFAK